MSNWYNTCTPYIWYKWSNTTVWKVINPLNWLLFFQNVDSVDEKTLCDVLTDHTDLKLSDEQKRSYFKVRNNINSILKNRANNVKVVIYIDNQYIQIIAGNAENHINFYINSDDSSFELEWRKVRWKASFKSDIVFKCW